MSKRTIEFGAMASPLWYQLDVDANLIYDLQDDADAITRLLVRGLITESEGHKARTRLTKKINKTVVEL